MVLSNFTANLNSSWSSLYLQSCNWPYSHASRARLCSWEKLGPCHFTAILASPKDFVFPFPAGSSMRFLAECGQSTLSYCRKSNERVISPRKFKRQKTPPKTPYICELRVIYPPKSHYFCRCCHCFNRRRLRTSKGSPLVSCVRSRTRTAMV